MDSHKEAAQKEESLDNICIWTRIPGSEIQYQPSCKDANSIFSERGFKFCYNCGNKIHKVGRIIEVKDPYGVNNK